MRTADAIWRENRVAVDLGILSDAAASVRRDLAAIRNGGHA
jgi:hypothetical protein